jgi:hypothetical protein
MKVSLDARTASIPTGTTAPLGNLLVTNDFFRHAYDGECNLGHLDPNEYLVGVQSTER